MANIYFGAYDYTSLPAFTNDWNTVSNWYSNPGVPACCSYPCPSPGSPGTPAGRLPTTSDTVIVVDVLTTPYSGGNWSGPIQIYSTVNAGTFSGAITLGGTIAGGTFNTGTITASYGTISGGNFNGTVTVNTNSSLTVSGGTFNGTISGAGQTPAGSTSLNISGGTFNTAIPSSLNIYGISGGTFDRDLTLGQNNKQVSVTLNGTISRNITLDLSYFYFNSFQNRNIGGGFIVNGGSYTGLITLIQSAYTTREVTGGSYSPPAVITSAIKSGNFMTYSSSAIPTDWGFKAAGGTFNPTINLSGTSNEILGAGLI